MRIDLIPDVPTGDETERQRPLVKTGDRAVSATDSAGAPDRGGSHYQRLFQSLYDAAIVSDLDGNILDANLRAEEFLGYRKNALCDLSVPDVISGADAQLLQTVKENLQNERHTLIQAYCLRRDRSYFPAEIAVTLLEMETEQLCFFIRDITLRKQAEEMLLTEHCAIQNSGNGIAITDLEGVVEYANPAAEHMWAIAKTTSLRGRQVVSLFADPEEVKEMLGQLREGESTSLCRECRIEREDGRVVDVRLSGAHNRNSDGDAVGFVFSIDDISDRKRADLAERESERRRVMIESVGAACHHLGQPSTVLLGNLELLKERLAGESEDTVYLVDGGLKAMESIVEVLNRLSAVEEYRTRQYLAPGSQRDDDGYSILDI